MSKGYIYGPDGRLEETIDYSCDGLTDLYCLKCKEVTCHWLFGASDKRGYIWRCVVCYTENAEAKDIRLN